MRSAFSRVHLIVVGLLAVSISCHSNKRPAEPKVSVTAPEPVRTLTCSSSDLDKRLEDNKPLYRAWKDFERTQKYRLAQPSDRKLTPDALAQVKLNQNQIIPYLTWWGAEGYKGGADFLIAIVVDPSRSDANRYGLVVIAATGSEASKYKSYWVAQEEDMESYRVTDLASVKSG